MCGITGILSRQKICHQSLNLMISKLNHRGPDDNGIWVNNDCGIGLGHARLSIIDTTSAGHQPMCSASGRYVIAFNGEIYNHLNLRLELENASKNIKWRGTSDTETLLCGFDIWGIPKTIEKINGMFAFSVWDNINKELSLVRDRFGEKPLYYGWQGKYFLFSSELKAIKQHPAFEGEINRNALTLLMRNGVIPAPYSIYQGIKKLLPGHILTISLNDSLTESCSYWNANSVITSNLSHPFKGTVESAVSELDKLLRNVVTSQMQSDVPLGAFLSGGIDSSVITAMMQDISKGPINTFTLGFQDTDYNEAEHAKAIAKYLGTNHTELYVTSEQTLEVIPKLASMYCEPFADASQIPTYLVSKLAREKVTVALTGDGGDEMFAGYNRHKYIPKIWNIISKYPVGIRKLVAKIILLTPVNSYNHYLNPLQKILPNNIAQKNIGEKLHKIAGSITAKSQFDLYKMLVSQWGELESLVINGKEPSTVLTNLVGYENYDSFADQMMAIDTTTYLPDDILVKVDRAAMAASLETRAPMLDPRIFEYAWSLPFEYKINSGVSKWILRQVLYKYVPKELIERPKMGFSIPIGSWLRGPLREWAEALLAEERLSKEGYFHPQLVRNKWSEHLSGKRNWQYHLWNVLMFQSWLSEQDC